MGKRFKKQNDNECIRTTVCANRSTIYTVCYMFSQDADEVNDLFQEVLVNLWKGFESFEHRSDIKTWIYRVALNTCISIDRKKKRRSSEVRLTMDINLFEDRDEDTKQVDMLLQVAALRPCDCPALAREPIVRGDRSDCRYQH